MKRLSSIVLALALSCSYVAVALAEDLDAMSPPPPINNSMLDSMVGTWSGVSQMMNEKTNDELKISWVLNHQFLLMELKSTAVSKPNKQYQGWGLLGLDQSGQVKVWWFDNWGASTVSTGQGKINGNQLLFNDSNAMFNEQRSFNVTGSEMKMHAKGNMVLNNKSTPYEQNGTYRKN